MGVNIVLIKKEFHVLLIHKNGRRYQGDHSVNRIFWSYLGGFILIFGARMTGGYTRGHVISVGMPLAVRRMVFALFIFAGWLITGRLFNKSR